MPTNVNLARIVKRIQAKSIRLPPTADFAIKYFGLAKKLIETADFTRPVTFC